MSLSAYSRRSSRAFTLLEMLVVIAIAAGAMTLLLPAISASKRSAATTSCQTNIRFLTQANLSYARDHSGRCVPDLRAPAYEQLADGTRQLYRDGQAAYRTVINTAEDRKASWFGQLERSYLEYDMASMNCPVVDTHRWFGYDSETRQWAWPIDYAINKFGVNTTTDSADEPSRSVMFGEPNMHRPQISFIVDVIAFYLWWGDDPENRSDLEQWQAGSLSFGFVDGHASRVRVPKVRVPFLESYPELALSAGSPPPPGSPGAYMNYFWWNSGQVIDPQGRNVPRFPPANSWAPTQWSKYQQ